MLGAILHILKRCLASIYLTRSTLLHDKTHHRGTQSSTIAFSFSITFLLPLRFPSLLPLFLEDLEVGVMLLLLVEFSFSITFAARGSGTRRYVVAAGRGSSGEAGKR